MSSSERPRVSSDGVRKVRISAIFIQRAQSVLTAGIPFGVRYIILRNAH